MIKTVTWVEESVQACVTVKCENHPIALFPNGVEGDRIELHPGDAVTIDVTRTMIEPAVLIARTK